MHALRLAACCLAARPLIASPRFPARSPTPAAVSKAFTCLSDPAKRRHYDAHGREEGAAVGGAGGGGGGFRGGGGGMGDIDPEELFNM